MRTLENSKIAVIGLGYVGLPLAVEFGKKYSTIGFDISEKRITELQNGHDRTLEVSDEELKSVLVQDTNDILTGSHGFITSQNRLRILVIVISL